jgi:pyruvate/2-oxoglutarate dehydrogenase complex dihydrolipoamide acyltransferase (E2) component
MSYSRTEGDAVTSVAVTMPETGSEAVARMIAWHRGRGESVETHEPLCIVAWDGVTAEIESPASGVLEMLVVAPGQPIATGATLARIDVPAEREPAPPPEPEPDPVPLGLVRDAPVAAPSPLDPSGFISPAVRRFSDEHGVDPAAIEGTGFGGRVTLDDVRATVAAATREA